jgi:hypothetical protein
MDFDITTVNATTSTKKTEISTLGELAALLHTEEGKGNLVHVAFDKDHQSNVPFSFTGMITIREPGCIV